MSLQLQPYVFFNGRCEEAGEFYTKAIGAKVTMMMRHKDSPEPPPPGTLLPGAEEKVMHMSIDIAGQTLNASDGHGQAPLNFEGFSLTLIVDNEAEAEKLFTGLCDGGTVRMPLTKTFFSPKFGMVADRFGLAWMVMVRQ